MVKALEMARRAARKAQEGLYEGICTVYEYKSTKDPITKISHEEETAIIENLPCRLSYENINAAVQTDSAAAVSQGVKLFTSPEADIKSGSKIVVTQNGITEEYRASGEPAFYSTHQEIRLELFRGWA